MNKKSLALISVLALVIISGLLFFTTMPDTAPVEEVPTDQNFPRESVSVKDGEYCFFRIQEATTEAPYASEEHIAITVLGDSVTGTKGGTQSGPGVSNGFTGTLTGTIDGSSVEVVYAYTVEGFNGKELESYTFENDSLIKSRWPLVEQNGVLVPNKKESLTPLTYTAEECN